MLLKKDKTLLGNLTYPFVMFNTEEEYNTWATGKTEDDLKRFVIIKRYTVAPGYFVEIETEAALNNLPTSYRVQGVLYGVKQNNGLYHFSQEINSFVKYDI